MQYDLKTIEATSNCFIYLFNKKNYTFFDVIHFFFFLAGEIELKLNRIKDYKVSSKKHPKHQLIASTKYKEKDVNTKQNYHLKNILPWPKGPHINSLHGRCGGSMDVSF